MFKSVGFPILCAPLFRTPATFGVCRSVISAYLAVPLSTPTIRRSRPPDLYTHSHSEYYLADIETTQPGLSAVLQIPEQLHLNICKQFQTHIVVCNPGTDANPGNNNDISHKNGTTKTSTLCQGLTKFISDLHLQIHYKAHIIIASFLLLIIIKNITFLFCTNFRAWLPENIHSDSHTYAY